MRVRGKGKEEVRVRRRRGEKRIGKKRTKGKR